MINHCSQPPEKCGLERCRMRNRERALEVVSIVRTDACRTQIVAFGHEVVAFGHEIVISTTPGMWQTEAS
jgi:hypothetical protein